MRTVLICAILSGMLYVACTASPAFSSTRYSYDALDRLVKVTYADGSAITYTYDALDRLIRVQDPTGLTTLTYDGAGRRLNATRGGVTTRYLYDPFGNLVAETDSTNRITRAYVHGLGLQTLVLPNGTIYNYHFDGNGNTVALTDPAKALVNRYFSRKCLPASNQLLQKNTPPTDNRNDS